MQRHELADSSGELALGNTHKDAVTGGCGSLIGESGAMHRLYRLIRDCADSEASVFLVGESGSGKELVARTIHELSARSGGDFVPLYCSALSPDLLEIELFSYSDRAPRGATRDHRGYLQRAAGGTLFLDEITELNAGLQARLLQVLESDKIRARGSGKSFAIDARIITATKLEPDDAVRRGRLREDLYRRLAQFPIHVPSLRERADDIEVLAEHFLRERNLETGSEKQFDEAVHDALRSYGWPGNVRELKDAIRHSHMLSGGSIKLEDLPGNVSSAGFGNDHFIRVNVGTPLAEVERRAILSTLEHYGGDKKKAANTLRISLKTLYNRLKHYSYRQ
ncbi:MAG: sigma 54-interacting transcriptional regulator [Woeseiaceae bacterium]